MQRSADAVPRQLAHHRVAMALRMALHRAADVPDALAGTCLRNALEQRLARDGEQTLGLRRDAPHRKRPRAVGDIVVELDAAIHRHDVALLEDAAPRNAVDDLVIDGDAGPRRIGRMSHRRIAEERRRSAAFRDDLAGQVFQRAGRDAWLDGLAYLLQNAMNDAPGGPDLSYLLARLQDNHGIEFALSAHARLPCAGLLLSPSNSVITRPKTVSGSAFASTG